jgi:IclR family KDG regulon transcriptional repressor
VLGNSSSDQEIEVGTRSLAAPVFDSSGAVVGAIGVIGTVSSLPVESEGETVQLVMDAARRLSRALGYEEGVR